MRWGEGTTSPATAALLHVLVQRPLKLSQYSCAYFLCSGLALAQHKVLLRAEERRERVSLPAANQIYALISSLPPSSQLKTKLLQHCDAAVLESSALLHGTGEGGTAWIARSSHASQLKSHAMQMQWYMTFQ